MIVHDGEAMPREGTRVYLLVKYVKEALEGHGVDGDAKPVAPSLQEGETEAPSYSCGDGVGSRQPRSIAPAVGDEWAPKRRLTARQSEILLALKNGATNKEIARELGIQESTVKVHLKMAFRQLKLKNRTQAALFAIQHMTGQEEGEHRSDGTPACAPGA